MKSHFTLGLGLASSLICGTVATADLLGLDYKLTSTGAVGEDTWTVDVYAVLNQGERLDAVAGDGKKNSKTVSTSGTFYQNPLGGPTSKSINPLMIPLDPDLAYDSWVTVGSRDSDNNALLDIGIDWTNFENGGDVYTINGTWFVTPADAQGAAVLFTNQNCEDKYGVLIAQLTVNGLNEWIFVDALLQGKDVNGDTWQQSGAITIWYPQATTDCNSNGVEDSCDILNGTSMDTNANGVPDECEFPDCNSNGIDDSIDIADGTSDDCNVNGTPDECESGDCNSDGILDDCQTLDDCDGNGIPDECEVLGDCNSNGIPDICEGLTDWDANGVADICEGLVAYNASQGVGYTHVDDAIADSDDGDTVWVQADHVNGMSDLEYHNAAIDIMVLGGDAAGFSTNMANGARLHAGDDGALDSVRSGTDGTASIGANTSLSSNFAMVYRDASLDFEAPAVSLSDVLLRTGSELGINSDAASVSGMMTCADGSAVFSDDLLITSSGELVGTVDLYADVENDGVMRATDDILIGDDFVNDGLVEIHRGVLYVLGDLTDNGTIVGEVDPGPGMRDGDEPAEGDGLRVVGNYAAGSDASLYMQHENWRLAVGGNFDFAINDNARFDMSLATLDLTSHAGQQDVEVMSADMGGIEEALDPTFSDAFPVGRLLVSSGATASLVDNHDNDNAGQDLSEVIYTVKLVVEPGATLNTNGYIIYTSEVDNQGTINGEDDVIIINPPMPGDVDGDGVVGILDILVVIADWGPCDDCAGDANADGGADILDILFIIANWS